MTKETPDAYQEAIHKLVYYMNDTVVFAKAQLPDVAQQMLVYGAHMAHVWMWGWIIAASMAFLLMIFLAWCCYKDSDVGGCVIMAFLLWVGFTCCVGKEYSTLVKIQDAPKLYLMDEMREKLKS